MHKTEVGENIEPEWIGEKNGERKEEVRSEKDKHHDNKQHRDQTENNK